MITPPAADGPLPGADESADDAYGAALDQLFARRPAHVVPDLDRITTLCELLGRPDQAYPSIQLTGTNGKTSTARMVAALFGALGLTAGTYTSPHLQDVRERIRVAADPISQEEMAARLHELRPYLAETDARHPDRVTFFEALTALAFAHFADAPVEVGVIEVGLGGRWDATNLARGEVAVLSRVGLDHADFLGSTVTEVATEKAGIIKDGAVVVSAPQADEAGAVIAAAAGRHEAQLVVAGRDFGVTDRRPALGGQVLHLRGVTGSFEEVVLPLYGVHQAANAACALAAVEGFLGFAGGLDPDVVREGFAAVRSPGRCEVVTVGEDRARIVLDGAHNASGAKALAVTLGAEFAFRSRVLVLGVLGDKDVEAICTELFAIADHVVVCEPPTERAAPADRIAAAASAAGLSHEVANDVRDAIERASGVAGRSDGIIVTGSLYTVGAARDALHLAPA